MIRRKQGLCCSLLLVITAACGTSEPSGPSGPPPASVELTPTFAALFEGDTIRLGVTIKDSSGHVLSNEGIHWSSGTPTVATVNSRGLVTSLTAGNVVISATSNGTTGQSQLFFDRHVAVVTITPATRPILVGSTVVFSTDLESSNGIPIFFRHIDWSVTNPAVASIDTGGVALFSGVGTTNVIASIEGVADTMPFTVGTVDWARLDAGRGPTCGLTTTGLGYCWGYGLRGTVGNGGFVDQQIPTPVGGGLTFSAVETGGWMSCGLTMGGAAYCWGEEGGIGYVDATVADTALPAAVSGGLTFTSLTVGGSHSCGVTAAGAAYCWGYGISGQLGNGGFTSSRVPVAVSGNLVFSMLSAGWDHTCGVTTDGSAYCWGLNTYGDLGSGDSTTSTIPVKVASTDSFIAVSAGAVHTCGIVAGGTAFCWGANYFGEMGTGIADGGSPVPVPVAGGLSFTQISAWIAEDHYTCGLTTTGADYCWGVNSSGQIGDGTTVERDSPTPVTGSIVFSSITTGGMHSCGTATDGRAYCWGSDGFGALGNGRPDIGSPTPVQVPGKP